MKRILRKTVGGYRLNFEKLSTVLVEAEATLNSRPLLTTDSMPLDGVPVLTPGHFLIGRPLRAVPLSVDSTTGVDHLRRWNLVRHPQSDLWGRWSREYLRELQRRAKWRSPQDNVCVGNLVLIKDGEFSHHTWPVGLVVRVYPGAEPRLSRRCPHRRKGV